MNFSQLISHPLKEEAGQSQLNRLAKDLDPKNISIDDRDMGDLMNFIFQFSRQVTFFNEDMESGNWLPFFKKSMPFLLAEIQQLDLPRIEADINDLSTIIENQPESENLKALFDYIATELIFPLDNWQKNFSQQEFSFAITINNLIGGNLQDQLKQFISLFNGANKWYSMSKRSFYDLQQNEVWGLDFSDLFTIDEFFMSIPGGYAPRITAIKTRVQEIVFQFLEVFRTLSQNALPFLKEVLIPKNEAYQKQHAPHLGLLFTFLELFKKFQGNINQISERHLEFFYNSILGIEGKSETPDQAHLVFELQKHNDQYLLEKDTLIKDGKDAVGKDILFKVLEDVVLDKAQVRELKTLFVNKVSGILEAPTNPCENKCKDQEYIEGIYLAPIANNADGVAEPFKDSENASWFTLGNKESKFYEPTTPPNLMLRDHPAAQIGFLLASSVLFLQEGERTIDIKIEGKIKEVFKSFWKGLEDGNKKIKEGDEEIEIKGVSCLTREILKGLKELKDNSNENIFDQTQISFLYSKINSCFENDEEIEVFKSELEETTTVENELIFVSQEKRDVIIEAILSKKYFKFPPKIFDIFFSGEQEWIIPENKLILIEINGLAIDINISIPLSSEIPAISFYQEEILKNNININLPVVKILLNPDCKILCETFPCIPCCDLEICSPKKILEISIYHIFECVTVENTCIEVEVCGIKNVVVQNDENVQDINGEIFPFGTRPTLNTSFYIGSREIFCKDWKDIWVNVEWKDRPQDLEIHYQYYDYFPYEDTSSLITVNSFKFLPSILNNGAWIDDTERRLFHNDSKSFHSDVPAPFCSTFPILNPFALDINKDIYHFNENDFSNPMPSSDCIFQEQLPLNVNSRESFIKFALKGVSFQHDRYAFVLVRHMFALSNKVDPVTLSGIITTVNEADDCAQALKPKIAALVIEINNLATIIDNASNNINLVTGVLSTQGIKQFIPLILAELLAASNAVNLSIIQGHISTAQSLINNVDSKINTLISQLTNAKSKTTFLTNLVNNDDDGDPNNLDLVNDGIKQIFDTLCDKITQIKDLLADSVGLKNGLPSEPYTPTIKNLSLDYCAKATKEDIELIHLYPCEGTYKKEDLNTNPTLFPTFEDEGTLYIGLENLSPGNTLNLLFQLAEATADSEVDKAIVKWHYLKQNNWEALQEGFHVLSDETKGLTRSGIVQIAIPADIKPQPDASEADKTSIMNPDLYWLKVAARENVKAIAETIGIHTQAVKAVYCPSPENQRTEMLVPKGGLAKLKEADTSIKGIKQFYDSFGGQLAEVGNNLYLRTSERLRHKGRAITRFDYERLTLEQFATIWKVKCINHTLGLSATQYKSDLELTPGSVLMSVIPDIDQLKVSNQLAPKVPVSLLEEIKTFLKTKASPFVKIKVMNPRYEGVNITIKVRFYSKNFTFLKNKLKEDIIQYLSPWTLGNKEALCFGKSISKSNLIPFIEQLDYVDYICELCLGHSEDRDENCEVIDPTCTQETNISNVSDLVIPKTARSILIAGTIIVNHMERDCEAFDEQEVCNNKPKLFHVIAGTTDIS